VATDGSQRREAGPQPGALSLLLEELARAPVAGGGSGGDDGPLDPALQPGSSLGRYELVRELGRGGFGVVWEARDRELRRRVAVKVARPRAAPVVPQESRVREAEAVARLSHPNIVTMHDAGCADGRVFLVFERLAGRTLARRLRDGPMPPGEAVRIATEVARGLAHAHARGVFHRDLKPENVFLCDDGAVKILDFGLAHAFGTPRLDGGTPGYMAPEQVAGAPEDERTDVFALGVMLFEMLAGRRPFEDDRALQSPSPAPALDVPGHPALGGAIARMLAKSPVDRLRDGRALLPILTSLQLELQAAPGGGPVRTRGGLPAAVRIGGLAALVAALVAGGWLVGRRVRGNAPASPPSVAVLPFADLSPQKDQEYLADGVAEEILTALSRVDGLRVPGRISSFYFKGRADDLRAIGARLDVAHVLEGTVRRSGDRLRVTAELVSVADGYRVWSESYDRPLGDVFQVQDEIARSVVAGLRPALALGARPAGPEARTASPEAYGEFLMGRHFERLATERGHRLALAAFERAVALDPGYAPAWAALGSAQANAIAFSATATLRDQDEGLARGRASTERAIALAPWLPDGWLERGRIRYMSQDWAGSRDDLERTLALAPRDPMARAIRAHMLAVSGDLAGAVAMSEAALRDDPLNGVATWYLGSYYNALGRHALARKVLAQALEITPENALALRELAFTDVLEGRPQAALETVRRCPVEWVRDLVGALAYPDLGRPGEGDAALKRLQARADVAAYQIAQVHAWRDERDLAFQWLERARVQRDLGMRYVKYDPLMRSVRPDPRFAPLLRRLDLPVD
jgi:serine/threonine-protein kinase